MHTPRPPLVSIVVPVYNGEPFLREALESTLSQTFTDFELIVINDGSTDGTKEVIESIRNPRIRAFHQENHGLPGSLNRGIGLSRGRYVARMDADDINHPDRIRKQVAFLNTRPEVGICGTWIQLFGNGLEEVLEYPADSSSIKPLMLFHSPLAHPSVMARRDIFLEHGIEYSCDYPCAEDYELWVRCSKYTEFANLPEVLLYYRLHGGQETQKNTVLKSTSREKIWLLQLNDLGISPTEEELSLHRSLAASNYEPSFFFIDRADSWLHKLCFANRQKMRYPGQAFDRMLADSWFDMCYNARALGFRLFLRFIRSPLHGYTSSSAKAKLIFGFKSLLRR